MRLSRRGLIWAGGAWLFSGTHSIAAALPPDGKLAFDVMRKGSRIGTHALTFEGDPENLSVQVAVELSVGIGPITLFRYRHSALERWREGKVVSVEAQTDNDGTPLRVSAIRGQDGFTVEATKVARYVAPPESLPATHWNRRMLDVPMINTQNGKLMRPTVSPRGVEAIPTATGGAIRAERFELTGDATLDTWYDESARWAGVRFKAGDGSEIRYERI